MTVTQTTAARDSVFTAVQAAKDNNYYPCFYNSLLLVKSRHRVILYFSLRNS